MELRTLQRLLGPLSRRIRLIAGRAVITLVNDSLKEQAVQVSCLDGETHDRVERYQHYGFTSHPWGKSEGITIAIGGNRDHMIVIADGDRRYRLKGLAQGEVALYDDQGQKIVLKRNKGILIDGCDTLDANVGNTATINAKTINGNASVQTNVTSPLVNVVASTKITCTTPLLDVSGAITAGDVITAPSVSVGAGGMASSGDISTAGNVSDGVRSMAGDRSIIQNHDHPGDSGGTTGQMNQSL